MRKVIHYFIKYPVAVNIIVIAVAIFGFIGLFKTKSSFFPLLDSENISISAVYPGASPEEVEEGIILKIEDNLKGLEGIERVTSVSRENSGTISVELQRGEDIYKRLDEVKNAIDQVPNFPTGMEPLVVAEVKRRNDAISFALTGKNVSIKNLKSIGRTIENELRAIQGISQIDITGYPQEEIEIAVLENELLRYNLTFSEVANAVRNANLIATGGTIKTSEEDYLIRAKNKKYFANDINSIVIKADDFGRKITLKDVAITKDQFEETPNALFFNGDRAVRFNITTTNTEDIIFAADTIETYIEEFNAKNTNVQLDVLSNRATYVKDRTALLLSNAFAGVVLVLIFLSLFLNPRLAFWVAFGLPISFLGLFIFAPFIGITINVLSLFGLIVVIGILVDDGIVIAENIYNHYEKGKTPVQAAIDGTIEVIPPILSAIITTILAFSIFLFLDSNIGKFFGQVSTVVIITLSVSLIEALIILPAHLAHSKALQRKKERRDAQKLAIETNAIQKKSVVQKFTHYFQKLNTIAEKSMNSIRNRIYIPTLRFVLGNRFFSMSMLVMLLILTFGAIGGSIIKVSLFPDVASTRININLKMPQGTNVKYTDSIITMIEQKTWEVNKKITRDTTAVVNIVKTIGPGTAVGSLIVNLVGEEYRPEFSAREISNMIRKTVGTVFGTESLSFSGGSGFGGSPISVSLLGNNIEELKAAKIDVKNALKSIEVLKDVTDSDPEGIKEIQLKLKDNAYLLGLNLNAVMTQVRNGFFGNQVQRLQRGQDEIKVWVRYDLSNRNSINNLDDMRIATPNGDKIPLREIAEYSILRGEVAINRLAGAREIQVNAGIKDNDLTGETLADVKANIVPEILSKYPSVRVLYEGQNRQIEKLKNSFNAVAPIILMLILITIGFTFRSYSQPFLLLIMIPFTLIGVAWGHYFHDFSLNALSLLGIIALIGITVNDGLVLISKLNSYLKDGLSFNDAIFEAGKSRFRAIFLTSITTIAGLAPLIFEKSRNAQFLIPMAISVAYGIAIATILTLLILPLLLSFSNDVKVTIIWLSTGKKVSKRSVERAVKEQEAAKKAQRTQLTENEIL